MPTLHDSIENQWSKMLLKELTAPSPALMNSAAPSQHWAAICGLSIERLHFFGLCRV